MPYLNEHGKPVTHPEYFKARLGEFIPNIEEKMPQEAIFDYDENGSIASDLSGVAEMAAKVQQYAASIGEEVMLHVDFTGGLRHANMIVLDVVRLLEYSGIKIGHLLYSKLSRPNPGKVEEVGSIYELFQLISGVEEVDCGYGEFLGRDQTLSLRSIPRGDHRVARCRS